MNSFTLKTTRNFHTEVLVGNAHLKSLIQEDSLLFLYDETLPKDLLDPLTQLDESKKMGLPPKESSKTWESVKRVIDRLETLNITRSTTLCAIGGGALTDVVAFIASIYLRGLKFYLVPTTLLAMVDASIGGKTAINAQFKNRVGTFYPAEKIFIDTDILATMPETLKTEGMSEIIKIALIKDAEFVRQLEEKAMSDLEIVKKAIALKIDTVKRDLTDQNERLLLNFGHTTGHALEAHHHYRHSHGACVAAGMVLDSAQQPFGKRVHKLLLDYGCFTPIPFTKDALIPLIQGDKKRWEDHINSVELTAIGQAHIKPIPLKVFMDQLPTSYPTLENKDD